MHTIIGAILGFVVGGGLATLAFSGGMELSHTDEESQGLLLGFFSVPVFLLGGVVGLTIGALAGARQDRRREAMRSFLGAVLTVIGAFIVPPALLATLLCAAYRDYASMGIAIAAMGVGVAICSAAWWLNRDR